MPAAVGHGVPFGLDFYCGSVVVVGLWAAPCSQRTQRSDPVPTIVMNVVAGDHPFLSPSQPLTLSSNPEDLGYL